jgi:hypothetical protein
MHITVSPWPESESELYRPSDRRLASNLVPIFTARGCHVSQREGSLRLYSRLSRPSSIVLTPLETHYFSETLVAQGIEPVLLDL